MKQRSKMMKSKKGIMVFIAALFVFGGVLFLANTNATADAYDHYFSGRVYYNGAPVSGAKVYLVGYFQCLNDPPWQFHWTVKKTLTTDVNGYFSGNIRQEEEFKLATLKAKYAGASSYTASISSPKYNNSNIILYINNPPPDEEDPCGPGPNCN